MSNEEKRRAWFDRWGTVRKGGPGSGNWGHKGIPGKHGGSAPGGGRFPEGQVLPRNSAEANASNDLAEAMMKEHPDGAYWDVEVRGRIKNEIVTQLSEDTDTPYEYVNDFIAQWSFSSNDEDMRSLAIQKDAAEEFRVPLSEFTKGKISQIVAEHSDPNAILRRSLLSSPRQKSILRAMYNNTQQKLAEKGLDPNGTVRLYRGVGLDNSVAGNWKTEQIIPIKSSALSSWSSNRRLADDYAREGGRGRTGITLQMDVPVKSIMGSALSGFGSLPEQEFVILGTGGQARVVTVERQG